MPDSAIDVIDEAGAVTRLARSDSSRTPEPSEPSSPVPLPVVDAADIEAIVARMARIPARQASASDRERLRTLEESLERVVFGQTEAVHLVAQAIKRSRAGLGLPDHPAGTFLFTGPTGVGKTELARQLAILLGNEFVRFDKQVKDVVTSWQMRGETVNDHSDDAYDALVLHGLAALHEQIRAWLPERFRRYTQRLNRAAAAVASGDTKFVASPRVDSYHSVWFELHEELILLAGRTRADEVAAGRA